MSIPEVHSKLVTSFREGKSKSYEWRIKQLKQLQKMMVNHENEFVEALVKDLGRPNFEAAGLDIVPIFMELNDCISSLKGWMEPVFTKVPALAAPAQSEIRYEPYGVCLIIGAFNYPVNLLVMPLIGAIMAGNCVVVKPSELAEHTERAFAKFIPEYLDPECISIVCGGIPVSTALLELQWDKIFYTGSGRVGQIVIKAASKYFTPVTLELGGKSPTYIDESVTNMELVTKRILWGKCVNAGQTCIAPDFLLIHEKRYDDFLEMSTRIMKEFYGENPKVSENFSRIISKMHTERLKGVLDEKPGKFHCGGQVDVDAKYIAPTLVLEPKRDSKLMTEEIFGPILPIVKVKNADEAIDIMKGYDKALALYIFGKNKKVIDKIIDCVPSGGVCVNDTLFHILGGYVPFGGVGPSGIGGYHGRFSFDTFSHRRTVVRRDDHTILDAPFRYPPYTSSGLKIFKSASKLPALPAITRKSFFHAIGIAVVAVIVSFAAVNHKAAASMFNL